MEPKAASSTDLTKTIQETVRQMFPDHRAQLAEIRLTDPQEIKQLLDGMRRSFSLIDDARLNLRTAIKALSAFKVDIPPDLVNSIRRHQID